MAKVSRRRLKELLTYDPETGLFIRRSGRYGGAVAGQRNKKGYVQIKVDGKTYMATHLAFLWMTGRWPKDQVDHEDLDHANDRWGNLREATNSQNQMNQRRRSNNTTGFKGVSFHKVTGKYQAAIRKDGRRMHLGLFTEAKDAHAVYAAKAAEIFGQFARFE